MKILAVDTSTEFLSIGVKKDSQIYTYRLKSERRHSSILLPSIKRILYSLRVDLSDIDYFSVGLGPGSFTGLRIGIATVKGFAVGVDKKVVGVPSLDIIAYNAIDIKDNFRFICPILDAKRELLYSALYQKNERGLKLVKPYRLISLAQLIRFIPPKTVVLGNGLGLYRTKLMLKLKQAELLDSDYDYPHPYNLIKIATDLQSRGKFTGADKVKPIYLYPKECQIKSSHQR